MAELAERIRRHFLWLLLPTYLVAYLLPGPGAYAAGLSWSRGLPEAAAIRVPMLLVAVLLLNAALQVELDEVRGVLRRAESLIASLVAVWLGPALVVVVASLLFTMSGVIGGGGLLLGMILVAAMPVANSSAGWTQQSGGSLSWALSLIVFSILLCPLVTPGVISLLGMSLSSAETESVQSVVGKFSGATFILWVLAPTIIGMLVRRTAGAETINRIKPILHLSTSASILALNYLNGSLVLPKLFPQPDAALLISAAAGATAICLSGVVTAQTLGRLFRWNQRDRLAVKFALSMKHTGLALGLASTVLADQPDAILLIIMATPLQHLVAGIVSRRYGVKESDAGESSAG